MSITVTVKEVGPSRVIVATEQVQGPRGILGIPGIAGVGSDKFEIYNQVIASSMWDFDHSLGRYPSVVVLDEEGFEIIADVQILGTTRVIVRLGSPIAGEAYLT